MIFLNGVNITDKQFPNGEINLLAIEDAINSKEIYERNHFVMKYEDDKDLMALHFAKKQVDLRDKGISFLSIAYMPYSRMDRAETVETPFMLKFVCDFINELNFEEVYVYEPHSDVTMKLLENSKKVDIVLSLAPSVMNNVGFDNNVDYIVYPDETAKKRYNSINVENKLVAKKKRDFETGKILDLVIEGEVKNKPFNALLVDDLCSRGGTFLLNAQKLKDLGADKIYLLVGHCENTIFDGEVFKSGLIDKVFTTNSILTKHSDWNNLKYKDKLKVYGMELIEYERDSQR